MKIWNILLRLAGLIFLLLGSLLAIQDGFLIDWWQLADLIWICVLAALFVTLLDLHWISGLCGAIASGLLWYLLARQWEPHLTQEWERILDKAIPLVSRYHHMNLSFEPGDWSHSSYDSRYFLILAALALGLWMGVGMAVRKLRFLTLLGVAAAFFCSFSVGNAPKLLTVLCLICGLGICFAIPGKRTEPAVFQTSLLTLAALLLVLGISAVCYRPIAEELLKHHDAYLERQIRLEDQLLALTRGNSILAELRWRFQGPEDQAVLSTEAPRQGDKIIFEMTVDRRPEEPIYVKNFTGTRYEKGIWYAEEGAVFSGFLEEQGLIGEGDLSEEQKELLEEEATLELTRAYRLSQETMEPQRVRMDIKEPGGNTTLWPYLCDLPKDAVCVGDAGIRTDTGHYEILGYPMGLSEYINSSNYSFNYVDRTEVYYVYLGGRTEDLALEVREILKGDPEAAYNALTECVYSFDLEPVPQGTDIVTDFLFRQKKGYCMHFATAQTLIWQSAHIPTRYASGYLVLPEDFRENQDHTYTAAVPRYRAHAWMEIYSAVIGWYPVEVTPPSYLEELEEAGPGAAPGDVLEANPQEPRTEEEPVQKEPTPEEDTNQEEITNQEENKTQGPKPGAGPKGAASGGAGIVWSVIAAFLGVILILAAVLALEIFRIRRIWRRREEALASGDLNGAALAAGSAILGLLRICKIRPTPQEEELSFAERVERTVGWIEPGAFERGMEILQAARYGGRSISEEERSCLVNLYWQMMGEIARQLKPVWQIWYCYFHVKVKK